MNKWLLPSAGLSDKADARRRRCGAWPQPATRGQTRCRCGQCKPGRAEPGHSYPSDEPRTLSQARTARITAVSANPIVLNSVTSVTELTSVVTIQTAPPLDLAGVRRRRAPQTM